MFLTTLALKYLRIEPTPPTPIIAPFVEADYDEIEEELDQVNQAIINTKENATHGGDVDEDSLALDMGALSDAAGSPRSPAPRRRSETMKSNTGSPRLRSTSVLSQVMRSGKMVEVNRVQSFRNKKIQEIPFEPITFSFKEIWYTVTLPDKEELDLLKGVSGYFEPGTLTALMGASGAGKTTLLDVLSGRKNTGVVKGGMFVNGKPKEERSFRKNMG